MRPGAATVAGDCWHVVRELLKATYRRRNIKRHIVLRHVVTRAAKSVLEKIKLTLEAEINNLVYVANGEFCNSGPVSQNFCFFSPSLVLVIASVYLSAVFYFKHWHKQL